jgi:RNA polymerase sigma-70 factor (ECF subfamily)
VTGGAADRLAGPEEEVADEALMSRYRDGDAGAFDVLYERHRGPLFRYVLRHVGTRALAEEIFQEVWINLINARARYEVSAKFTTYLFHVAHNRIIDHVRRRPPLRLVSLDDNEDEEGMVHAVPAPSSSQPEVEAESRQLGRNLLTALGQLPADQRDAFLLHEEGGLTLEEIAQMTGVGRETVKSRLRYALAKLREGMSHDYQRA